MKKRKYIIALSLAGMGALNAFASVSAASLPAGTRTEVRDQTHSAIKRAFKAGDYQAFLEATKDNPLEEPVITKEQFDVMIQAEKRKTRGDMYGAKLLLRSAWNPLKDNSGQV